MRISLILCLILCTSAAVDLEATLSSPALLLQAFHDFGLANSRHYATLAESRMRYKLFRDSLSFVASLNKQGLGWKSGVNFFADMTPAERQQYLGLNITMRDESLVGNEWERITSDQKGDFSRITSDQKGDFSRITADAPETVDWIAAGHVTPVKNQGGCGSCWTFGATVAVEGRYRAVGGKLKSFAEQEYLDCVYPTRNGCHGGWHTKCFDYSRMYNRLATTTNYPYTGKDAARGYCDLSGVPNGLQSATITGYTSVPQGEARHIAALTTSPTAVAFEVTNAFQMYQTGIIKDRTCRGSVNHAVAAVGYSPTYIVVKNSWGASWGDEGFVKFGRNWHNCQLSDFVAYPTMDATQVADTDPETAPCTYDPDANAGPTPGPDPIPDPDCKDEFPNWCKPDPAWCDKPVYFEKLCRKTCNNCWTTDKTPTKKPDEVCPSGTVRCDDGVCRHEHMCH